MEEVLEGLNKLPREKIKESWFWSEEALIVQREEIQSKINLLRKERKLQPPIASTGMIGGAKYVVRQYQILNLEKGLMLSEFKTVLE